ncbi:MAG: tetratricopeptide repeat protein [Bdellovibrionota bacterium]
MVCAYAPASLSKTVKKTHPKTKVAAKAPPAKALPLPPPVVPPVSDLQRDFSRAEDLFKSGQEDAAIVSLTDFLRRYPSSDLADDAQYLLGEIEFRRRNFDSAIRELKKTLNYRGKGGDRVADAYYLVGDSLAHLGKTEDARIEWEALRRAYPHSPAAGRAALKLMEISQ